MEYGFGVNLGTGNATTMNGSDSVETNEQQTTAVNNTENTQEVNTESTTTTVDETTTAAPATEQTTTTAEPELTDDIILKWAKSKNESINSIDELFSVKEVEKVVEKEINPYADVMDEETIQFLNFKKETGFGRNEFDFVKKDFDAVSPIELAIEKARRDSGMDLNKDQAFAFLERKLGIDLSDLENIDIADQVELNSYVKPFREEQKAQKEKFLKPVEGGFKPNSGFDADKYIALEDGSYVPKEAVERREQQLTIQRNQFLKENKSAVDGVAGYSFKVTIDENGSKKDLELSYDVDADDRQAMLSISNDTSKAMESLFRTEDGKFQYDKFNKALFFANEANLGKFVNALTHKVRAQTIEEIHQRDNNTNFGNRQPIPSKTGNVAVPYVKEQGYGFPSTFLPNN